MVNIFFDLDGTLINSQQRLYNLFVELCPECKMTYEEYWEIKRQRINQKDFLKKYFNYSDEKCKEFHKLWLEKVEESERLDEDFLVDGVEDILNKLSQKYRLYLVTNRQSKSLLIYELERLKIKNYFCDILVTEQKRAKSKLIQGVVNCSPDDILIGDTGEDIKTAKELGIKSIAVSWGILDEKVLMEYLPDRIIGNANEIEHYFI